MRKRSKEWTCLGFAGVPCSRSYVRKVFRTSARGAGLKDFHFHTEAPRRHPGVERGVFGADRYGVGRVEDGAYDAQV